MSPSPARLRNRLRSGENARLHLAAIVESSDDAIISTSLDGTIESWNRGAERLFGYTAQEAIGRPVTILLPPERLDEETRILRQIRAGARVDHYETVRMRKDNSRVDISLSVSPVLNAYGRIVGASKIGRDISDRKRAEAALDREQAIRERLLARRAEAEALANAASLLTASLDPDALAQKIVSAVRELLRCQAALCATFDDTGTLVVRAVAGSIGPFWRPGLRVPEGTGHTWRAIRASRPMISRNILTDTELHWTVEMRAAIEAAPYRSALALPLMTEGRVIGAISLGDRLGREFSPDDVRLATTFAAHAAVATDNARLHQSIESASRAKDEFLAMLGHELRNPLGAIVAGVNVLKRAVTRPPGPPDFEKVDALIEEHGLLGRELRVETGEDETRAIAALSDDIGRSADLNDIPHLLARALTGGLSLQGVGEGLGCRWARRASSSGRRRGIGWRFTPIPRSTSNAI